MNIVAISEKEWMDLKSIRLASLLDAPSAFGVRYQDAINYSDEEWKLRASRENGPIFFIAYIGEKAVGLIGGIFANEEYELISMWVAPEHRGGGVSIGLVETLQAYALNEGHKVVMLKVSPENEAADGLYRKCGFSVVGSGGALASNDSVELQKMEWRIMSRRNDLKYLHDLA